MDKKKILYISFLDECKRPGYKKKLYGEARAFHNLDCESYMITFHGTNMIYVYHFSNKTQSIIK